MKSEQKRPCEEARVLCSSRLAAHASPAERLVDFVAGLRAPHVPASAIICAKWCLLDTLGCALFGSRQPWSKLMAAAILAESTGGQCSLFGHTRLVPPPAAALCNGTASHGFELDDLLDESIVHPGAIIVPAALATAEAVDVSGGDLVLGIIAGYEVMDRVGLALGLDPAHRGFHKTSLAGPIGAAAAAAVIMKLPADGVASAIGLACSAASGIKTFAVGTGGGMMKRMHAGRSAEAGVRMAQLAARGFKGPATALESRFGLLEVYGGATANASALDSALGEHWAVEHVFVKVFPCCSWIQAPVQLLLALRGERPVEPHRVKRVRLGVNSYAKRINGAVEPSDTMGAQYSLPYCAALALIGDPHDPRNYEADAIDDASRRALARRVELVVDEEMEAVYPKHYGARVELQLEGGELRTLAVLDPHGMPAEPCTDAERVQKFSRLASRLGSQAWIEEIVDAVTNVDKMTSVQKLTALVRKNQKQV